MSKFHRYAAIDVGSNAVRLLLSTVTDREGEGGDAQKISWVRIPVRLGSDAFTLGRISETKVQKFLDVMTGFGFLIKAFDPVAVMACATAAMRTADNGEAICRQVLEGTGIPIRIIEGKKEAAILFRNKPANISETAGAPFLFIDVGGGSTEMTIFFNEKAVDSKSFNIGTIRLLEGLPLDETWRKMEAWVREKATVYEGIEAIGSGGNINKLFRLAGGKAGRAASYQSLIRMKNRLGKMDFEQRMKTYSLRPDRADVIVPGSEIYLKVMKWAGCKKIHVPQRGLADGMIRMLHEAHMAGEIPGRNGFGG